MSSASASSLFQRAESTTELGPHWSRTPSAPRGQVELRALGIEKSYRKGSLAVPVLRGVDFEVRRGEFLAVMGASGSGKSTLLHVLATLDTPDAGEVLLGERRIDNVSTAARDELRNRTFGMIFQFYHLLPELSALENVMVPLMIRESAWGFFTRRGKHRATAKAWLELVGLSHRATHLPRELSGGEMQRAAIARALVSGPQMLLADEPTGNLDHATGREILKLLVSLNREHGLTIVMVTHDPSIAEHADRVIRLVEGRLQLG